MDAALSELGGIDVLLNNVGAGDADRLGLGGFLDVDGEQWRDLFALNLFSAVWTTRAVLPSLLDRRGVIVNIASINSHLPSTVRSATARPRRLSPRTLLVNSIGHRWRSRRARWLAQ